MDFARHFANVRRKPGVRTPAMSDPTERFQHPAGFLLKPLGAAGGAAYNAERTTRQRPSREVLPMSSAGDVTRWLEQLKAGDREAAQPLWEQYFRRLVGLARERLRHRGLPRAAGDEEDVQ